MEFCSHKDYVCEITKHAKIQNKTHNFSVANKTLGGNYMDNYLFTPGPSKLPKRVLDALSKQVIPHRCDEYYTLFKEYSLKLQQVFQTKNPVITFPAAGTGGMEASIVNFFSLGDKVLLFTIGEFGERFGEVANRFGLNVIKYEFPYGTMVDLESAGNALKEHTDAKGILITHNETATSVTNDLENLCKVFKDRAGLLIVDSISGLGGIPIKTDQWDIDVVITGSQKALMSPPGLTFLSVSEKAQKFMENSTLPSYYWDIKTALEFLKKDQNPYTPGVNLIAASSVALDLILEEGLENVYRRHEENAKFFREGALNLGFTLLAQGGYSSTITAVYPPKGIETSFIEKRLLSEFNIYCAGGQGTLKGKILRFGHMGATQLEDIKYLLNALKIILN